MGTNFVMKECLLHESKALQKVSEKLDKQSCDNALLALNYTFVTNDGSIMWRKRGDSHGTINKVYTKNSSIHYTHWMRNPSI